MDALVGALWKLAIAVLDYYLDKHIDRLKDESVRATARRLEDEVVAVLAGPIGAAIAQGVARSITIRALERWFPNDKTTGHWG